MFCRKYKLLLLIIKNQEQIMLDLTALKAIVTKMEADVNTAIPLLSNPATDQATIDAVVSQLTGVDTTLAQGIESVQQPAPPPAS